MAIKKPLVASGGRKRELPAADTIAPRVEATFATLTDAATISWDISNRTLANAIVTLGGNRTLAMTNLVSGATGVLIVNQDASGSRAIILPSGSKIVGGGGTSPTLSTTANSIDVLAWIYDGTKLIWTRGVGAA